MKTLAGVILATLAAIALAAPLIAPHPSAQHRDYLLAPPMRLRVIDTDGRWHRPFVYPIRLADRLTQRYEEDRSVRIRLEWFTGGRFVRAAGEVEKPLLLLGSDRLGRDVFSRLAHGGRTSLAVAVMATVGAVLLGVLVGGFSGYAGGSLDEVMMRIADFFLVLPTIYVLLALRAALPLVLPAPAVFGLMVIVLALVAWPTIARGVRSIVTSEREREFAEAARAAGAGHVRLLARHLLPATGGFVMTQAALLLPAFIMAEATLSFVGLGFPEPTASWGTLLRDAAEIRVIADAPWLLSPAVAILVLVLAVNTLIDRRKRFEGLAPR